MSKSIKNKDRKIHWWLLCVAISIFISLGFSPQHSSSTADLKQKSEQSKEQDSQEESATWITNISISGQISQIQIQPLYLIAIVVRPLEVPKVLVEELNVVSRLSSYFRVLIPSIISPNAP